MNNSYWSGKRVVVTGGAGMVGAQLVRQLVEAGAQVSVIVLDDFSRGNNRIRGAKYIQADAADYDVCCKAFLKADAVFNLAAYVAGVTYNAEHQTEMFERNFVLQATPLLAASQCRVPDFLQVSSVCVYGDDAQNPCIESRLGGEPNAANAGYAWAKRVGEIAARNVNINKCIIVRPANIYGLYDYFDERAHVIPALIRKALEDDMIRVNGTGNEVREFLYSTDAASGMMIALEKGQNNQVYNIGTDGENSCTISELAYTIRDILQVDKSIEFIGGEAGDNRRIVNGDKLMRLGWGAKVKLPEGLRRVCEWYKNAND